MKLNFFIMFVAVLQVSANHVSAQKTHLDLKMKDASLAKILDAIEDQSGVYFFYNKTQVDENQKADVDFRDLTVEEALTHLSNDLPITYEIVGKNIIIKPRDSNQQVVTQQRKAVSGKVTDPSGAPLPGVTIAVKGTASGTITDASGHFTLSDIPSGATLVFSFVGMKTQEIPIAGKTTINVTMAEEAIGIDEVVAIGYGTMKKVNLTGSISQVNGEKLENRPVTNALSALQGTASGVVVTRSTGQPGKEGYTVEIRGLSSVNGGKALVLVDGSPGDISTLNPSDIESVSVLKDAAASAIYGARAAGGVILVTTKKGNIGKLIVEYNGLFGGQSPMMLPDRLHSWEEETLTNIGRRNAGKGDDYKPAEIEDMKNPDVNYADAWWNPGKDYRMAYDLNQIPLLVRDLSPMNDQNISLRGGTEKEQFFMSLGYYHQQGIFKFGPDDTDRINGRFNYFRQLNKTFSLDTRLSYRQSNTLSPAGSVGGTWGMFYELFQTAQIFPIFLLESNDTKYYGHGSNCTVYPILKDGGRVKNRGDEFSGVFTFKAKDVVEGLTLSAVYSPRYIGESTDGVYRTVPRWNRVTINRYINNPNRNSKDRTTTLSNNVQFLAD
ncbi:MAG: SusC/RagA family TonB-linked outer membrane protein, partial [Mangrovibacterium sp.]|nr:SusC/RagA family TonB-linked outer membrane protein [Mangrovibacterium sp.]